jgi:hypothetical protein
MASRRTRRQRKYRRGRVNRRDAKLWALGMLSGKIVPLDGDPYYKFAVRLPVVAKQDLGAQYWGRVQHLDAPDGCCWIGAEDQRKALNLIVAYKGA